jgi:hypothetical protein
MLDSIIANIEMEQLTIRFDIPLALVSPDELYQNAEAFIEVLKEDRRFERKSAKSGPRLLGEYLSMWANTAPDGGLIALGIEDKGNVLGCKQLTQTELNEREQAGKVFCPDARPESKLVPELTPEESRAINYIQQHGKINVSQLHNLVSSSVKTWHTCRKILFGLEKKGILEYKHRTDILKDPKACFVLASRFRCDVKKERNGWT